MVSPESSTMSEMTGDKILDQLRPSIFRIETRWFGGAASATGFTVSWTEQEKRLVLVTAGHVLKFPVDPATDRIEWTVQQFDRDGGLKRELRTETPKPDKGAIDIFWHHEHDVGFIVLPKTTSDGKQFFREDETRVKCIPPKSMAPEGTRVGWAGFAGIIEEYVGHPQLGYFEGVITAAVNRPGKKPVYIVDGHSARGVSGGPLWRWNKEGEYNVMGIMSGYGRAEEGLPGFCIFEPIQPVTRYLEWANEKVRAELKARENQ